MSKKQDTTWSIKHEGKLNPNNIIFTNKYKELSQKLKEVDDSIKEIHDEDPGLLVCTVCNTGSNPAGHAEEFGDVWIAYCHGCGDYGEFIYEKYL
tara:strand:- start:10723 stop:11007 length:285 start_codon:yes stop_codon:yes gene_type:complete